MERQLQRFVNYCIKRGYIEEEKAPWLYYAIQKRIAIVVVGVPFLFVGIWLSSVSQAVSFLASFYFLRERTSGAHCKNMYCCLVCSLLLEIIFLGVLPGVISPCLLAVLVIISSVYILWKAPFPCPYMHMDEGEMRACAVCSKIRVLVLLSTYCVAHFANLADILTGIGYGIVMAAFLLAIAYINPKENVL